MKKLALLVCTVLIFISCVSQPAVPSAVPVEENYEIPTISESEANELINSMIMTIDRLIKTSARDKMLKELWNGVAKELMKARIRFIIDRESNDILSGAMFFINTDNSVGISVSNGILSIYKVRPSLAMAIMVHELTHFYSYLLAGHKQFIELSKDRMERNWFEADAIHMEAVFIEQCLEPVYDLTPFEKFVLTSWQQNNIDSATILMARESSDTILAFYGIAEAWINRNTSLEETLQKANKHVLQYINAYNAEKPNTITWAMNVIAIESCKYYYERLINTILSQQKSAKAAQTIDAFLGKYPESRDVLKILTSIVQDEYENANTLLDNFIKEWESMHKKYIQVPQKQAA